LNSKNWKLHHEMREICTEIHVGISIHSCWCIVLVIDEIFFLRVNILLIIIRSLYKTDRDP
jgi:hypothetical protein